MRQSRHSPSPEPPIPNTCRACAHWDTEPFRTDCAGHPAPTPPNLGICSAYNGRGFCNRGNEKACPAFEPITSL